MNKKIFRLVISSFIVVFSVSLAATNKVYADAPVIGTWIVETNLTELGIVLKGVVAFNKDKTLTSTGQTGLTGIGVWEKVGNREYKARGVQVIGPDDPNFLPGTYVTQTGIGTFEKNNKDSFIGQGNVVWTYDGAEVFSTPVTSTYTRLTLDD